MCTVSCMLINPLSPFFPLTYFVDRRWLLDADFHLLSSSFWFSCPFLGLSLFFGWQFQLSIALRILSTCWLHWFWTISELSATNWGRAQPCWKRVPDDWSCDVETPSAKLSYGLRNQHIGRAEIWPTRDISDWQADLSKVGWASALHTVEGSDSHLIYTVPQKRH